MIIACFVALRLAETVTVVGGWVAAWGDDVLCLPLVLTLILAVHRLAGRPANWTLPLAHGVGVFLLYTLLFEVVLPRYATRFTADAADVAAYAAGFVVFQTCLNRPGGGSRFSC